MKLNHRRLIKYLIDRYWSKQVGTMCDSRYPHLHLNKPFMEARRK
jgi:hypothetical protein